jgi:small-conductance mechanosensitive channel
MTMLTDLLGSTTIPRVPTPDAGLRLAIIAAVVGTMVFLVVVALIWRARQRLLTWIDRRSVEWTKRITSWRLRVLGVKQIRNLARIFVRMVSAALLLGGGIVWLAFVLELFAATRAWGDQLIAMMLGQVAGISLAALSALPGLGVVLVIVFFTRLIHEFFNHYFRSIEDGEVKSELFDEVTAEITRRLAGVGLWLAALIVAYPYIPGSDSAAFKGVSLLAGVMVSLGSTNLIGQMVNGLMIIYSHAVRPGDFIETGEVEGVIDKLGLFSCSIRTAQGVLIVVPNSTLAAGLKNYSRAPAGVTAQFVTAVTIGYDVPWRQVRELLLAAAADVPDVRKEPAPIVRQAALEDFYVRYELVFAPVDPATRRAVLSDVHAAILERFHAAGVQIMSPHYRSDPATVKIPPVGKK